MRTHPEGVCTCPLCCPDKWAVNAAMQPAKAQERLDVRMRREKLESAIAWFSGEKKPSNRRVSRGDLREMLIELKTLRSTAAHPGDEEGQALRRMTEDSILLLEKEGKLK